MGDDGEKMGGWPGTYELCWGKEQWVEHCFTALERERLAVDGHARRVAGSAAADRSDLRADFVVRRDDRVGAAARRGAGLPPAAGGGRRDRLAGGTFPARRHVAQLPGALSRDQRHAQADAARLGGRGLRCRPAAKEAALDHLYRGQSNDCYWHGLFGGIYLVHMRMATLAELIAAEDIALGPLAAHGTADYDLDGTDEVLVGTTGQTVLVDVAEGGGLGRGTCARRGRRWRRCCAGGRRPTTSSCAKFEAAAAQRRPRRSARTRWSRSRRRTYRGCSSTTETSADPGSCGCSSAATSEAIGPRAAWAVVSASESAVVLSRSEGGLSMTKSVSLGGDRLAPTLTVGLEVVAGAQAVDGSSPSSGTSTCRAVAPTRRRTTAGPARTRHDARASWRRAIRNCRSATLAGRCDVAVVRPGSARDWYPVETVSNSEAGFERVYQGSCLTFRWPLRLAAGERATFSVRFDVEQDRDLRAG